MLRNHTDTATLSTVAVADGRYETCVFYDYESIVVASYSTVTDAVLGHLTMLADLLAVRTWHDDV